MEFFKGGTFGEITLKKEIEQRVSGILNQG